ncbi:MAG: AAA family ATPase, partial [Candidatus Lokiarchaeota archaeon]|nr:AAA family ATPase [Candidatus Lokiarchaeota archaeon]
MERGRQQGGEEAIIKAIELRNWRSFDAKRIDLDGGLNFIIGPNSSGKSSIIQALTFAFFGKAAFKKKDLKEFKKSPKSDTGVVVTFMTPSGQVLHLERVVKSAKEDAASLRDASHAEITADTAEIAKHVRHLVNDSVDYFKTCNYIGEGDIFSFIGEPQSSIMDHIDSFTKVAQYEPYKRKIDALSKASVDEMEALKKRLKGITATPAPGDVKGIDKKIADLQAQVAGLVPKIATEKATLAKIDEVARAFDEKTAHAKRVQELEDGNARASKAIDVLIADLARLGIQIQAGANIEAHIAKE